RLDVPQIVERVQRRAAARLLCEWPVSFTVVQDGRPEQHKAQLVNISATGAAVLTSVALAAGQRVPFVVLPRDESPLPFVAEVVGFEAQAQRLRLRFVSAGENAEPRLARLVTTLLARRAST
ncbi:MAG TPA: PilZ domain-containing protein, partial [Acidimicrobiales bacterium]